MRWESAGTAIVDEREAATAMKAITMLAPSGCTMAKTYPDQFLLPCARLVLTLDTVGSAPCRRSKIPGKWVKRTIHDRDFIDMLAANLMAKREAGLESTLDLRTRSREGLVKSTISQRRSPLVGLDGP